MPDDLLWLHLRMRNRHLGGVRQIDRAERTLVEVLAIVVQKPLPRRMHIGVASLADAPRRARARVEHIHAPAGIALGESRVDKMPPVRCPARRVGALFLRRHAAVAGRIVRARADQMPRVAEVVDLRERENPAVGRHDGLPRAHVVHHARHEVRQPAAFGVHRVDARPRGHAHLRRRAAGRGEVEPLAVWREGRHVVAKPPRRNLAHADAGTPHAQMVARRPVLRRPCRVRLVAVGVDERIARRTPRGVRGVARPRFDLRETPRLAFPHAHAALAAFDTLHGDLRAVRRVHAAHAGRQRGGEEVCRNHRHFSISIVPDWALTVHRLAEYSAIHVPGFCSSPSR